MMACAHVIGSDTTVAICAQHGNFELNTMMPVLAYNLLHSIELLSTAVATFTRLCVAGITAHDEKCLEYAERSLALVTALVPVVGHDAAAELGSRAVRENRGVREVAQAMKLLPEGDLDRVLDLMAMTRPGRVRASTGQEGALDAPA
jgi:fumarate hydratase class II